MSEPAGITSPHAPDVEDVRRWLEKIIKASKLFELVAAIIALITRLRDINTELTKRLADSRRKRPRSEILGRVERQVAFAFAAWVKVIDEDDEEAPAPKPSESANAPDKPPKRSRRGRHPGRPALPAHLPRVIE